MSYSALNFEGVLTVTDPVPFLPAIARGFGASKAYGCEFMLIRRAQVPGRDEIIPTRHGPQAPIGYRRLLRATPRKWAPSESPGSRDGRSCRTRGEFTPLAIA